MSAGLSAFGAKRTCRGRGRYIQRSRLTHAIIGRTEILHCNGLLPLVPCAILPLEARETVGDPPRFRNSGLPKDLPFGRW
jgi:hypothetical protein